MLDFVGTKLICLEVDIANFNINTMQSESETTRNHPNDSSELEPVMNDFQSVSVLYGNHILA